MYMVSQCHILSSTKEGPMELKWIIVLKTCGQSPIIREFALLGLKGPLDMPQINRRELPFRVRLKTSVRETGWNGNRLPRRAMCWNETQRGPLL